MSEVSGLEAGERYIKVTGPSSSDGDGTGINRQPTEDGSGSVLMDAIRLGGNPLKKVERDEYGNPIPRRTTHEIPVDNSKPLFNKSGSVDAPATEDATVVAYSRAVKDFHALLPGRRAAVALGGDGHGYNSD